MSIKKLFSGILALAMVLTIVAQGASAGNAQSMNVISAYNFTTDLQIGSRGADVIALQSFLELKGLIMIPAGVAKGYFGGLTKSAVQAFQASKGISTTGYFGPLTRAAVGVDMVGSTGQTSTVVGCSSTAGFSSVTGQSCAATSGSTVVGCSSTAGYSPVTGQSCSTGGTSSTVVGCTTTAGYSSVTGQSCASGTTTSTGGVMTEGSLDIRLSSNPADNANVRTQTDVPVYGLDIRSRISDVTVQTLDLQVNVMNGASSENPQTLINTIKVMDGSSVLAIVPVTSNTFTKDQNQVYYVRIPALNFVVPKDQTKTLTVTFSTNSIDSDRVITIDGYQTSSVRATSGNDINSFYSIDGSGFTRSHTFKKPGTSTLTLSAAGNTLRSQNYRVNGTDTLQGVTLAVFNLKSVTGESKLLTVNASTTVNATGTLPTTLYLYQGSTLLKSKTVLSSGSVSFDNLDSSAGSIISDSQTPTTYTIKADFPSNTVSGTYASTTVTSVIFETPNGNTATASGSNVTNQAQYVYGQAAQFTLNATPSVSSVSDQSGRTTSVTATFSFNAMALGANVVKPVGTDFVVKFATSSAGVQYTADSVTATVIPNNDIADGSSAQVNVTASISSSTLPVGGLYTPYIASIKWVAGTTTVNQTYGLDDYKSPTAVNVVK